MNVTRNKLSFEVTEGTPNESFWKMDGWEKETYEAFDQFITKDKTYLDVGAWIGPTVLYGAQLAKKVHTFEPDPVAWDELQKNIALNGFTNIIANNFALSDHTGILHMGSDNRLGESVTRVGDFKAELSFDVKCVGFDEYIASLGEEMLDINFIKVDIEGGESVIAESQFLRNNPIPLLLSLHPPMMPNFIENIETIIDLRSYYLSCQIVSGKFSGEDATEQSFRTTQDYYTVLLA